MNANAPGIRPRPARLQIQLQVENVICQNETVCAVDTERGALLKPFRGFGPTNRTYEITGMEWLEVRNEKAIVAGERGIRQHSLASWDFEKLVQLLSRSPRPLLPEAPGAALE